MDFYQKYLKYKSKYIDLRNQIGGAGELKLIFIDDNILNKIIEEDTRLLAKVDEAGKKISASMDEMGTILNLLSPGQTGQTGGIPDSFKGITNTLSGIPNPFSGIKNRFSDIAQAERALKESKKKNEQAEKAAESAVYSIESAAIKRMDKIVDKLVLLQNLLSDVKTQTTKCNIIVNGMPFYNALSVKEKLTWKVENLDNVHYTYYGKNMNTIVKNKSSSVFANLKDGYGDNYINLKNIIEKIPDTKYILVVKDFAGSPDLFICCFTVDDGANIRISDPNELKKQLNFGVKGTDKKKDILKNLQPKLQKVLRKDFAEKLKNIKDKNDKKIFTDPDIIELFTNIEKA
jgi:hypothetical protein